MSCCESCSKGKTCESIGAEPSLGLPVLSAIQVVNGVPTFIGVPGQQPPLDSLFPSDLARSMLGGALAASTPAIGLPMGIPLLAAMYADKNLQPGIPAADIAKTVAALWLVSGPAKSAGWQDKGAASWLASVASKSPQDKNALALMGLASFLTDSIPGVPPGLIPKQSPFPPSNGGLPPGTLPVVIPGFPSPVKLYPFPGTDGTDSPKPSTPTPPIAEPLTYVVGVLVGGSTYS